MPQCPICQTEYQEGKDNYCSTCSWDLTQLSMTVTQIPNEYLLKLSRNLDWAKKNWLRSQSQEYLTQEQLEDINQEKRKLKTEIEKLQRRLQRLETENEKLEINIQKEKSTNNQQQQTLQSQLQKEKEKVTYLSKQEQIAKAALSNWLHSGLLELFVVELESITKRKSALTRIKELKQKRFDNEWYKRPANFCFLEIVMEFLENSLTKEELEQTLNIAIEKYHVIVAVDALLKVRSELKYNRIIQRDHLGDNFHGL